MSFLRDCENSILKEQNLPSKVTRGQEDRFRSLPNVDDRQIEPKHILETLTSSHKSRRFRVAINSEHTRLIYACFDPDSTVDPEDEDSISGRVVRKFKNIFLRKGRKSVGRVL